MDRYDERRGVNDTDETSSTSRERDVLGLGDSTVPQTPGDPGTSYDPDRCAAGGNEPWAAMRNREVATKTPESDPNEDGATPSRAPSSIPNPASRIPYRLSESLIRIPYPNPLSAYG